VRHYSILLGVASAVAFVAALTRLRQVLPYIGNREALLVAWVLLPYIALVILYLVGRKYLPAVMFGIIACEAIASAISHFLATPDARFAATSFTPVWQLAAAMPAAFLLSKASPGSRPSVFGRPLWRWGVTIALSGIVAQVTPMAESSDVVSLKSSITLCSVGLGLLFALTGVNATAQTAASALAICATLVLALALAVASVQLWKHVQERNDLPSRYRLYRTEILAVQAKYRASSGAERAAIDELVQRDLAKNAAEANTERSRVSATIDEDIISIAILLGASLLFLGAAFTAVQFRRNARTA